MDNVLKNINDVLIIRLNPKIKGEVRFEDFQERISGITETRKLKREFRISQDDLFWTDWLELNKENLSSRKYITDNHLSIEIRYTREGSEKQGDIVFSSIDFRGDVKPINFIAPTLQSSIFAGVLGTDELSELEKNIFKKLYYRGILPNYIIRANNDSYDEDKDFIDLFFSIARFYSIFLSFFKRWENFRNDIDLLREQVRGYGIYFNESDTSLEELQYLASNIFSQAQQRGTKMMFVRKGEKLPNGEIAKVDGEFLRLVRNKESDEILVENIPTYQSGWCLGKSSPIYKGTAMSYNLNKTKENTKDFKDLKNFLITQEGNCSSSLFKTEEKSVLKLEINKSKGEVGLGRVNEGININDNVYKADSQLDYEITFSFKVDNANDSSIVKLLFGVEGFDVNKNKLNDAFITPDGSRVSETFFNQPIEIWKAGQWYYVRGIIHAYSSSNKEKNTTNIGIGNDLYFNNSFVKYIIPKITIKSDKATECSVFIWDYKIRPLVRGKNIIPLKDGTLNSFSLGFIQSSKILHTYFRNNNNGYSENDILEIIEKNLYPYDTSDLFTIMTNY